MRGESKGHLYSETCLKTKVISFLEEGGEKECNDRMMVSFKGTLVLALCMGPSTHSYFLILAIE